jgi:hypothetical protein
MIESLNLLIHHKYYNEIKENINNWLDKMKSLEDQFIEDIQEFGITHKEWKKIFNDLLLNVLDCS